MEERGRLIYEETIIESRAQAELNAHHIGIFVSFIVLIFTWIVYGYKIWNGIEVLWVGIGIFVSLFVTLICLYMIDILVRLEFTRNLPIKVYGGGILMPTTQFDRILWKKQPFIHESDLEGLTLIKAHNPDQKDTLIATTKKRKSYPKRYHRNSKEVRNIIKIVQKTFPKVKVEVNE